MVDHQFQIRPHVHVLISCSPPSCWHVYCYRQLLDYNSHDSDSSEIFIALGGRGVLICTIGDFIGL